MWYLKISDEISGPHDVGALKSMLNLSKIDGDTLISTNEFGDWKELSTNEVLSSQLVSFDEEERDFDFLPGVSDISEIHKKYGENGLEQVFCQRKGVWMTLTEYKDLLDLEEFGVLVGDFKVIDSSNNPEKNSEEIPEKHPEPPPEEIVFPTTANHATAVYVSNLPLKINGAALAISDVRNLFSSIGPIQKERNGSYRIKLYRDKNGDLKGDGSVFYTKAVNAQKAILTLNGTTFGGQKISVQVAVFEAKKGVNVKKTFHAPHRTHFDDEGDERKRRKVSD
eukprot:GDKJ01039179.1.p1 GENE.GDKJ01039179.1~~GDKJ01039179.1.p1  ORF type:complete len:281 (-),score=73.10 GDKJ01039179.1:35-877(-)